MQLGPYIGKPVLAAALNASGILFHYCPKVGKGVLGNRNRDIRKLSKDMVNQRHRRWAKDFPEFGITPTDQWVVFYIDTKDSIAVVRSHLATAGLLLPKTRRTDNKTQLYLTVWKHHTAPYALIRTVRCAGVLTYQDTTKLLSEVCAATQAFLDGQERVKLNRTFKAWLQHRKQPVHNTEWTLEYKVPVCSAGEAKIYKQAAVKHYRSTVRKVV